MTEKELRILKKRIANNLLQEEIEWEGKFYRCDTYLNEIRKQINKWNWLRSISPLFGMIPIALFRVDALWLKITLLIVATVCVSLLRAYMVQKIVPDQCFAHLIKR